MSSIEGEEGTCAICQDVISKWHSKTDCGHEFCLECICRQLSLMKNTCCVCRRVVARVTEVTDELDKIIHVRYRNAEYDLNISLWSFPDPIQALEQLFSLKEARIACKGTIIRSNNDLWPGMKILLFGTSTSCSPVQLPSSSAPAFLITGMSYLTALFHFICLFFRSIFCGSTKPRTAYTREEQQEQEPFLSPGTA